MKKFSKGFTLVELLTVMGVIGVVGSLVVSLLVITFRGMKKLDAMEYAQQNGDIALSQMIRAIRYAKQLDIPTSCVTPVTVSSIKITSLLDNAQTTYSCGANAIASNGASLIDDSTLKVSSCSFYCSQQTDYQPPTLTVKYVLEPRNNSGLIESTFSLPFQSSVTMRNYVN